MDMRYVTAEEMRRLDREAVEKRGVTALELMEKAGLALAKEAMKASGSGDVTVFCGYGNNGGDGFVAARHLARSKYGVTAYIVGTGKRFSKETEDNYCALDRMGVPVLKVGRTDDLDELFSNIQRPSVVIDAIFGIGIHDELDQFYSNLIEHINEMNAIVISADIPSGLDADTGNPRPVAIKAHRTVTFGFPKTGFRNPSAKIYTGEVVVADIGLEQREKAN